MADVTTPPPAPTLQQAHDALPPLLRGPYFANEESTGDDGQGVTYQVISRHEDDPVDPLLCGPAHAQWDHAAYEQQYDFFLYVAACLNDAPRLAARVAQLEAALLPLVKDWQATYESYSVCAFCSRSAAWQWPLRGPFPHADDCLVLLFPALS